VAESKPPIRTPDPKKISALPTRDFFIDMVTRDIPLDAVILDLVDNSVDGAKNLRGRGKFDDLEVRIEADPEKFSIADNCGGFSSEVAREYAFRFGRLSGEGAAKGVPWAVGTFGIGMKRAIFRLGRKFYVRSTWESSKFDIEEDVEEWRKKGDEPWEFRFKHLDETARHPIADRGTEVRVTHLFPGVADKFKVDTYFSDLAAQIGERHREALERGLHISVNGVPAKIGFVEILQSSVIKPILIDRVFRPTPKVAVRTRVVAGIGRVPKDQDPEDQETSTLLAGWYVYCNGRELLHADKSRLTGWGDGNPSYHPQFAMFRGYVFFDCADPTRLPWNTTKTGVEPEHPVFQRARLLMIPALREVTRLLNARDREYEIVSGPTPITDAIGAAKSVTLDKVKPSDELVRPVETPVTRRPKKTSVSIQYSVAIDVFNQAKERLEVTSPRPGSMVGRKTFQYYVDHELN
jgi:hypothetical protein